MDKKKWTNVPHSRVKETVGNNPGLPNEPSVDQLGDEELGFPPSLLMGLLTGLVGALVGGVSLPIYFFLREPHYYVSPEWLIFVLLGAIVGVFLRLERPFYRERYCLKTKAIQQAQVTDEYMDLRSSIGFNVDLDK